MIRIEGNLVIVEKQGKSRTCYKKLTHDQRRTQGRGFGGWNLSLLEVKAMLLMADIVKLLSNDSIHFGSNKTLKKRSSKIGHFCLLTLSEPPL